jgi:phage baseplate assembly protein V
MTAELMQALERTYRRVMLAVGRGRVATVSDAGAVQTAQVKLGELETRDNTPRLCEYGFASNPPVGSDAIVLFVGGDRSNAVIVATGHQASRKRDLKSGEVAIYDTRGQSVYLTAAGIVVRGAGLPVTITDTPRVTIDAPDQVALNTALLKVSGDILDNAGGARAANSITMRQMRELYNRHRHSVPNIEGGGDTAQSEPPDTPQGIKDAAP